MRIVRACFFTISFPAFLLCVLLGVTLGAGAYTAYYAEGFSYLSDDPKACVNCHVMREHYDGWQKASHHGYATCNDCHLPADNMVRKYLAKGLNGYHHSKAFTLQDFHEPIRIGEKNRKILMANCIRCHESLVCDILQPGKADGGIDCIRCHERVGHGPTK